jgi:hypothetical protein
MSAAALGLRAVALSENDHPLHRNFFLSDFLERIPLGARISFRRRKGRKIPAKLEGRFE